MKFLINTKDNYYIRPVCRCLQLAAEKFKFELEINNSIPPYSIWIEDKPIAYLAHRDSFGFPESDRKIINKNDFKIIFKYHFSPSFDYGKYSGKIVSCGLYRWLRPEHGLSAFELLKKNRSIAVVARMSCCRSGRPESARRPCYVARRKIVEEAKNLEKLGIETCAGKKVPMLKHIEELLQSKIGFNWEGTAYLNWRIPEHIQCGVVLVTQPLGKEHPIREDICLEDGDHCVFCDNPNSFGKVAKELLNDSKKLEQIRKNVVGLWFDKLCPEKMGEWYYRKIISVL